MNKKLCITDSLWAGPLSLVERFTLSYIHKLISRGGICLFSGVILYYKEYVWYPSGPGQLHAVSADQSIYREKSTSRRFDMYYIVKSNRGK